jgi:tight adherence protein B
VKDLIRKILGIKEAKKTTANLLNNDILDYTVYNFNQTQFYLYYTISMLGGAFVASIFYGGLFKVDGAATLATTISNTVVMVAGAIIGARVAIPIFKKSLIDKRNMLIQLQFRDMLESLTSSITSGSNIEKAFGALENDMTAQFGKDGFMTIEVEQINQAYRNGIPVEQMLIDLGERTGNRDIKSFANVFSLIHSKGGDMRTIIRRTTDIITEKVAISEEIETSVTSNKMQHKIMTIAPIGIIALLKYSADMFASAFASMIGVVSMTVALVVFVVAYRMGEKIVDIK